MRNGLVCIVAAIAMTCLASTTRAVETLAYSFEVPVPPNGPDGFFGLGATVSQDTIGTTNGLSSLKYAVAVGGFVGARTESVIPLALNDPPGVDYVLFDMYVPAAYADSFADIGVTVFGHATNPGGPGSFGNQVQFADTVPIAGKAAGQYLNLRIDLDTSQGPYRPGESFNQIFGSGPNDLAVASAFQFYISKNVLTPVTVYIDNVRLGVVPEPATFVLCGLGCVALGLVRRRSHG